MSQRIQVPGELTELERAVLDLALAPDVGENGRLREQAGTATVSMRTPSGVGFMTKLEVSESLTASGLPAEDTLPPVFGAHPGLPSGAEFVVQLRSGRLNTIEAFCYEGMWPADESLFRLEIRP